MKLNRTRNHADTFCRGRRQYLQERALPRSVTGAKDPTAPTQSEGGIDRYQLSNAPEVAVTLERHSLSPYRLTLTDGL